MKKASGRIQVGNFRETAFSLTLKRAVYRDSCTHVPTRNSPRHKYDVYPRCSPVLFVFIYFQQRSAASASTPFLRLLFPRPRSRSGNYSETSTKFLIQLDSARFSTNNLTFKGKSNQQQRRFRSLNTFKISFFYVLPSFRVVPSRANIGDKLDQQRAKLLDCHEEIIDRSELINIFPLQL